MERPAVQEMLELVRSGRINCVAVKDFSRFSRNAVDSGYFIEQVFPLYQVRFISFADHFDSANYKNDTGGLNIAIKFLVHEYYSADLSKKVKSAKRIKMLRGEHIVAGAIYGYRKNDLGKWEPDPEPAGVVRDIFHMAQSGYSTTQIRDKLCAARLPTPREYTELKHGKDIEPKCVWTTRMVLRMLENEQYTGTYISGKQESKAVGSHSKNWVDKAEWIMKSDSHPPIVSKDDFTAVQTFLSRNKYSTTAKPVTNSFQKEIDRPRRKRMIAGEYIASNAAYGYVKDSSGNLVIDQTAAKVIQEAFQLAAQGLSVADIRNRFTEVGYHKPADHIKLARGHEISPSCQWTLKSIRTMLQNIQYTGAYVTGKYIKDYETGKLYHTPKSDWIIIPGKHPPIVCETLFDEVQQKLADSKSRQNHISPRDYLLRGDIVKCAYCGYAMGYDNTTSKIHYRCNHTLADPNAACHKLKVSAAELDETVLTIIRKKAEVLLSTASLSELRLVSGGGQQIADYKSEINKCIEQRQQIYEQFVLREIDRETYHSLKAECAERLDRLNNQIGALKQTERDKQTVEKSTALAESVLGGTSTPREIVEKLIDKIYVSSGKQLEIRWKIASFAV